MITILTISLICYLIHSSIKFDKTKIIVEKRIQNLTVNYKQRRINVEQKFQQRFDKLQAQLSLIQSEKQFEINNLKNTYEQEKSFMNSTAFILYSMHIPTDLVPGEVPKESPNFLRF
jgi:hypothetical protein